MNLSSISFNTKRFENKNLILQNEVKQRKNLLHMLQEASKHFQRDQQECPCKAYFERKKSKRIKLEVKVLSHLDESDTKPILEERVEKKKENAKRKFKRKIQCIPGVAFCYIN